jgi:integrase/recombinase XerD
MTGLDKALVDYLRVRRALGFKLKQAGELLPDFVRYLEDRGLTHVTTTAALAWATLPRGTDPNWWSKRLVQVRGFAKYLHTIDPHNEVPLLGHLPHRQIRTTPYVYTDSDVTALLAATDTLRSPFRTATYKTLLGLIAVTGLRVGEAIALDDGDVDRVRGVLVIRKAKFGKSRDVPLHLSTVQALECYRHCRDRLVPRRRTKSFFVANIGTRLFLLIAAQVVTTYRGEGHHWPQRRCGAVAAKGSTQRSGHESRGGRPSSGFLSPSWRACRAISIDRRDVDPLAIDRDHRS